MKVYVLFEYISGVPKGVYSSVQKAESMKLDRLDWIRVYELDGKELGMA